MPRKSRTPNTTIEYITFAGQYQGGNMRFKRVSKHFWTFEANGIFLVGTWQTLNKELSEVINNGRYY